MLRTRVITALLLLAGFLALLFLLPFSGWLLFSSLIAGLGGWEWGGLMNLARARRLSYSLASLVACAFLGWLAFDAGSGTVRQEPLLFGVFVLAGLFWLLLVPVWLRTQWHTGTLLPGMLAGWIVLIPACLALMQLRAIHPLLLLACVAAIWVADIAAYFSGGIFGRRKLAPSISPGKTWEGAAGALVGVLAYGLTVAWLAGSLFNKPVNYLVFLSILLVLTAVSILGDLFESMAKRQAGVKDSGVLLPGHGGILDRIDSLTSTLPLVGLVMLTWEGRLS